MYQRALAPTLTLDQNRRYLPAPLDSYCGRQFATPRADRGPPHVNAWGYILNHRTALS